VRADGRLVARPFAALDAALLSRRAAERVPAPAASA
jgi:hypothetical protein